MKNIEKKDKRKIVLSLLIAMAFILPATSAFGSNSVEEVDASDEQTVIENIGETPQTTEIKYISTLDSSLPMPAGPGKPCYPVEIADIALLANMPLDTYDIEITIDRPDCGIGVTPDVNAILDTCYTHIATDTVTEQDTCTATSTTPNAWRQIPTGAPNVPHNLPANAAYGGNFNFDVSCGGTPSTVTATVTGPINWVPGAGDYFVVYRDYNPPSAVNWKIVYDVGAGTFTYHSYAGGGIWNPGVSPPNPATFTCTWVPGPSAQMIVSFESTISPYRMAAKAINTWGGNRDYMICPDTANQANPNEHEVNNDDTSNYLVGVCSDMDDLDVYMAADCDYFYWFFENQDIEPIGWTAIPFDANGNGVYDANEYIEVSPTFASPDRVYDKASGNPIGDSLVVFNKNKLEFKVARNFFVTPDGSCYCNGINWQYCVTNKNAPCGSPCYIYNTGWGDGNFNNADTAWIDSFSVTGIDCSPAIVKAFCSIFKAGVIPDETMYCTDFEDTGDIFNNWESIDVDGGIGGIDTWCWSDQESNSPSHSFHCSQFDDTYMGNQLDYLETTIDNSVDDYFKIMLEFYHLCEGEFIDTGNGDILEDYGWVEYRLDGGAWTKCSDDYYSNATWDKITIDIPSNGIDIIDVRFVWSSGPVVQNAGWYIDDVCFYGSASPYDDPNPFQTHSLGPVTVDDCSVKYTFPNAWSPDEGDYYIDIWMITEPTDDCHYSDTTQQAPFTFYTRIGDYTDAAVISMNWASPPFNKGDTLVIEATVENQGTVDLVDLPVTFSIQEQIKTYMLDDYMETGEGDWGWMFVEGGIAQQMFHLTELKSYSPTHSWTNQDETTGNYEIMGNALLAAPIDPFEGDPIDLDFSAMINYKLDLGGDITPVFRASTYYWDISVGLGRDPAIMGPASSAGWTAASFNNYVTSLSLYWEESYFGPCNSFIDLLHNLNERYGPPGQNVEDFSEIEIGFLFEAFTTPGSSGDTGLFIDNARITKITPGAEKYKDVIIIPELKAETPSESAEKVTLEFRWADMPTGDFIATTSVPPDDDNSDNEKGLAFDVTTPISSVDPLYVEHFDLTEPGDSHWHITTSGYDNYLWCGEESTGTYGDEWDDIVLLAPSGSDPDPSMDWSGLSIVYLELDDYCEIQAGYDFGAIEINAAVSTIGHQWYQYDATVLYEDFEDPLVGWTTVQHSGLGDWTFEDYGDDWMTPYGNPTDGWNYGGGPGEGDNSYMEADSDEFAADVFDVSLFTPSMDLSLAASYRLEYMEAYYEYYHIETAEVWLWSGGVPEYKLADYDSAAPFGYIWYGFETITIDPNSPVLTDNRDVQIEFYYSNGGGLWAGSFEIDDVRIVAEPTTGDSTYDWVHGKTLQLIPNVFFNENTGNSFLDDYPSGFTDDMGLRFRFISDEDYHERGWILDDINLHGSGDIFGPDACDNMNNFITTTPVGGDWWKQTGPTQWCCKDVISDLIPNDINNALVWETSVPQAFDADLYFTHSYDLELGKDYCYLELSNDGNTWAALLAFTGTATGPAAPIDIRSFIGEQLFVRWRVVTDDVNTSSYYCVEDMKIVGQIDTEAPVSTGTFAGTVLYGWYSTPVTMTLSATDDVSGIKGIYYTLDGGTTKTYSAPVSIGVNGDHTVEFWAVDNVNNEETPHHTVSFKIDTGSAPSISITAPTDGLYLFGNKLLDISRILIIGAFTVEATASDADSGVKAVEFFLDGTSIGSDTSSPYSILCADKHRGAGTITAVATDYTSNEAQDTLDITYYKFL